MKTLLLSMLLALPAFAGTATLEDLEALAGQSAWVELLERAEDVPPAKRNDAWRGLVTKAATAVVQTDESRAQALSTRYGFLAKEPGFSKLQGTASVATLEKCLRRDDLKDALTECVSTFRKTNPKADALVEAARLLRKQWNPAAPVELYADAAASAKETCSDAGLSESVLAALELPRDATRAAAARKLAFETCWTALAPAMKQAMVHASSYLLKNACEPLRAKKALTEMQDELCRDEAAR
ncbi:MAG: hypothetical protein Q8L14_14855 [Myxococcales bacterium]|nr:hypothetical protein [Myxococcales bacterium]